MGDSKTSDGKNFEFLEGTLQDIRVGIKKTRLIQDLAAIEESTISKIIAGIIEAGAAAFCNSRGIIIRDTGEEYKVCKAQH